MAEMKNYAAMAQGMPQEQGLSQEDMTNLQQADFTAEDHEMLGMPTGNSPEAIKERIIQMLERYGALQQLNSSEKMQIMQDIDQMVQDLISGNLEGAAKNPVNNLMMQAEEILPTPEELGPEEDGS